MMRIDSSKRSARARRRLTIAVMALLVPLAALGVASPALATPKGIFAPFADCPIGAPGVTLCVNSQTASGEFKIGKTTVPVNKTITLQGGGIPTEFPLVYVLAPAKDGNTLSKTELNVPGGLSGLINCTEIKGEGFVEKAERELCKGIFENKITGVTATAELVASAHNPAILNLGAIIFGGGAGITLPIRVHLNNPLLGSSCYIGSEASPIQLNLTDGTTSPPPPNKPISGKVGSAEHETEGEFSVLAILNNTLVDNAFSAPAAEGCGGLASGLIDPLVDARIGLPSAAGSNTAILNGAIRAVQASEVTESEK
jgi:hypothetical protein